MEGRWELTLRLTSDGTRIELLLTEARVIYDDSKQTREKLASVIDMLGFKARVVSVAEVK